MANTQRPILRPINPRFSSGPCTKHPNWELAELDKAFLGRSHRAAGGKARLKSAIDKTRQILKVPDSHKIAIVPASDTGAVEMALWSLLGSRPVDILAWESFGLGWIADVKKQLKLDNVNEFVADYGKMVDLSAVNCDHDVVFTWNGTTSGVRLPHTDWINVNREGLTICDATSAAFSEPLDFTKLDVVTYSWQKVLGGEAAHGMLILSERAIERLESYTPPWPMPKIFRLTNNGKLNVGVFNGETLNTPSMLCVEDYIYALEWAESIGGLQGLHQRTKLNAASLSEWVDNSEWITYLCDDVNLRSLTSACLKIVHPKVLALPSDAQIAFSKAIIRMLDDEDIAYDIGSHRDAPPGLRVWTGATVEHQDIERLTPWLDWAFSQQLEMIS